MEEKIGRNEPQHSDDQPVAGETLMPISATRNLRFDIALGLVGPALTFFIITAHIDPSTNVYKLAFGEESPTMVAYAIHRFVSPDYLAGLIPWLVVAICARRRAKGLALGILLGTLVVVGLYVNEICWYDHAHYHWEVIGNNIS